MTAGAVPCSLVFFVDIDNTLLDNDRARTLLDRLLSDLLGDISSGRFWAIYERVREETGLVDFPEIIRRFRMEAPGATGSDRIEATLMAFPFSDLVYADTRDAIVHMNAVGMGVVTSDGDGWFQPAKARKSGIEAAVNGRLLIVPHKEEHYGALERRYPADRYVVVDDKLRILEAAKAFFGERCVTVWVCQGKYAVHKGESYVPDMEIDGIGDLRKIPVDRLCGAGQTISRDG